MSASLAARLALALMVSLVIVFGAPAEADADSKGKGRGKGSPKQAAQAPAAPARPVAVAPVPTAAPPRTTPVAASRAAAEVAGVTTDGASIAATDGTITTEEARALIQGQTLPEPAPPVPTVDPLSQVTPVRSSATGGGVAANGGASRARAAERETAESLFPVPAPLLVVMLLGSVASVALVIRATRRAAAARPDLRPSLNAA